MIVDLFAGAGGWDVGLRSLGMHDVLGIETDDAACATREAAGLATVQADVSALDPADYPCDGLIASPPCQDYSMAGKRVGVTGERGMLIHEVMRWARVLEPQWVACEQVPPALPVWRLFARELTRMGYRTWCGLLRAEEHGVPQTRTRAILMATKGALDVPEPTHTRYRPRLPDRGRTPPEPGLWGRRLSPWISMADALGWGLTHAPAGTITAGGGRQGGPDPLDGGSGAREFYRRERREGRWRVYTGNNTTEVGNPYSRSMDDPAPTLDTHVDSKWVLRVNSQENASVRGIDEPAPTVFFGSRGNEALWERHWGHDAPATTIAGDPRMTGRAHHDPGEQGRDPIDVEDALANGADPARAVRVTVEQAATLQGYPDHPWQGTKTKRFEQVGNSIPPPLAAAVCAPMIEAHRGAA